MKPISFTQVSLIILLIVTISAHARILNVPDDFETVQAGIDAAEDADTVLVQPGWYTENIDFLRKEITVASTYILDPDENIINETIIAGGGRDCVVRIEEGENTPTLTGFTIRDGVADLGAGISVRRTDARLSHLVVSDNVAEGDHGSGGGIFLQECAPILRNLRVLHNRAQSSAGLRCSDVSIIIEDVTIFGNRAENSTGGISLSVNDNDPHVLNRIEVIENSATRRGGMRISSDEVNITLNNCIISGNTSGQDEIVSISNRGNTIFNNCIFTHNVSENEGVLCLDGNSNATFNYCSITDNISATKGALYITSGSDVVINYCTIANNLSEETGGIYMRSDNSLTVNNSIIYGNTPNQAYFHRDQEFCQIRYSDIQDGQEGIIFRNDDFEVDFGENCIELDPMFIDPENSDYHLSDESPCLDAADPAEGMDQFDTWHEMGAYPFETYGNLSGRVVDARDNSPIEDAEIIVSSGRDVDTDGDGVWEIQDVRGGVITVRVSKEGYNDFVFEDVNLQHEGVLELNTELLHGNMLVQPNAAFAELELGDSQETAVSISNEGNGVLNWSAEPRVWSQRGREQWDFEALSLDILPRGAACGICFQGENIYFSYRMEDGGVLLKTDRTLQIEDSLLLPPGLSEFSRPYNRLAWDGENLLTESEPCILKMSIEGEIIDTLDTGCRTINGLTWDPIRNWVWVSGRNWDSEEFGLFAFNVNGERQRFIPFEGNWGRLYLAFFPGDEKGSHIYILNEDRQNSFWKINEETSQITQISDPGPEVNYMFNMTISHEYEEDVWTMLAITYVNQRKFLRFYYLDEFTEWMSVSPSEGLLESGNSQDITLSFNTKYSEIDDVYEGRILFENDGFGDTFEFGVILEVLEPESVSDLSSTHTNNFRFSNISPNPFNSTTTIGYYLPVKSVVTINVFDLTGRLQATLVDKVTNAGNHEVKWSPQSFCTGMYFVQMQAGEFSSVRKVMLLK